MATLPDYFIYIYTHSSETFTQSNTHSYLTSQFFAISLQIHPSVKKRYCILYVCKEHRFLNCTVVKKFSNVIPNFMFKTKNI